MEQKQLDSNPQILSQFRVTKIICSTQQDVRRRTREGFVFWDLIWQVNNNIRKKIKYSKCYISDEYSYVGSLDKQEEKNFLTVREGEIRAKENLIGCDIGTKAF